LVVFERASILAIVASVLPAWGGKKKGGGWIRLPYGKERNDRVFWKKRRGRKKKL